MFRSLSESSLLSAKNVREVLTHKAEDITPEKVLLLCHSVKRKLLAKYFSVQLTNILQEFETQQKAKDLEKGKIDVNWEVEVWQRKNLYRNRNTFAVVVTVTLQFSVCEYIILGS